MPNAPIVASPFTTSSGIRASRSMSAPSTEVSQNSRIRAQNSSPRRTASSLRPRMRVDQVELEVAQEQLLAEAGLLPPGLPGFLRHLPCLALADVPGLSCLLGTHRTSHFLRWPIPRYCPEPTRR